MFNKRWYYRPIVTNAISTIMSKNRTLTLSKIKRSKNFQTKSKELRNRKPSSSLMGATEPKTGCLRRDKNDSSKKLLNSDEIKELFFTDDSDLLLNKSLNKDSNNDNVITMLIDSKNLSIKELNASNYFNEQKKNKHTVKKTNYRVRNGVGLFFYSCL